MAVNHQLALIVAAFDRSGDHPDQLDQPQQMIGMAMTDKDLMDLRQADVGPLQLSQNAIAAARGSG